MKGAKGDVAGDPHKEAPARPVVATQHEYAANNREKADKANEDKLKWAVCRSEFAGVINKPDHAGRYEQTTDNGNGERTFGHVDGQSA